MVKEGACCSKDITIDTLLKSLGDSLGVLDMKKEITKIQAVSIRRWVMGPVKNSVYPYR